MNDARRKQIATIVAKLDAITSQIVDLQTLEQDYYDNMPESFHDSDKGEQAQAAIDNLDSAVSSITDGKDALEEAAN